MPYIYIYMSYTCHIYIYVIYIYMYKLPYLPITRSIMCCSPRGVHNITPLAGRSSTSSGDGPKNGRDRPKEGGFNEPCCGNWG